MKGNRLRWLLIGLLVGVVTLLVMLAVSSSTEQKKVRLSDGRLFHIEAVTFGTNHVVGVNDWWLVPLRKVLPNSVIQFLTLAKGQSRQKTDSQAVVVWVYACDAATGRYVDCQGVRASFVDEQGDVYPPNGLAHDGFSKGFNRQAYTFEVFPRRSAQLTLRLSPEHSDETSTVLIANPCRRNPDIPWRSEALPAVRRVDHLEFRLESLAIQTNGGPQTPWVALSLHWQPVFKLSVDGTPATNWEMPEWEAEDATGNRGQTLGLHEPVLKFMATVYPKPEAVSDPADRWRLPVPSLPTTAPGLQWNTKRVLKGVPITIIGLFPPGSYTFSEGQLTNAPSGSGAMQGCGWTGMSRQVFPGKWNSWATHRATNYTAFLRWPESKANQRIAVGLR